MSEYIANRAAVATPAGCRLERDFCALFLSTMNRSTLLAATADLSVSCFDHPPHEVHQDPDVEVAEHWSVAFVQQGRFSLQCQATSVDLSAGSILLTQPGLRFSCAHGTECPDDVCLAVRFEPEAMFGMEGAWDRLGWTARARPTPRLALVHRRLALATAQRDAFEVERWALASLEALQAEAMRMGARGSYAVRPGDLDAVIAASRNMELTPTHKLSVAERARSVGMTSTQLTHAFARYLGVSPHQYVVRWRLNAAAALLNERCSVSESCYRAGFENLSHFCRSFSRQLGVRASHWHALTVPERRRKVQAMLAGRS